MKWADGAEYKGEWMDGQRHGKGDMHWQDGSQYMGDWKEGAYNGWGTLRKASGLIKTGLFTNKVLQNTEYGMPESS